MTFTFGETLKRLAKLFLLEILIVLLTTIHEKIQSLSSTFFNPKNCRGLLVKAACARLHVHNQNLISRASYYSTAI